MVNSIHFFFVQLNSFDLTEERAGVIWKGDKLIYGVPETLHLLRSKALRPLSFFHSFPDSDIDHMLIIY